MIRRFIDSSAARVGVHTRADGTPIITGYGAVFWNGTAGTEYVLWDDRWGRAVERILPGAFDGALSRPDDVRGLFNHDPNLVLGRTVAQTMTLSRDAVGLKYDIVPGEASTAKDVMAYIQRGDVSGSSFSFNIPNGGERWTGTKDAEGRRIEVREILAVELWDVGPVTFPAYAGTSTGVRGMAPEEIAELRKAREAVELEAAEQQRRHPLVYQARARAVELESL